MGIVAGIGSRKTPPEALTLIRALAARLRERGHWLRTGGAAGADQAWAEGAGDRALIYRPWPGYRDKDHPPQARLLTIGGDGLPVSIPAADAALASVERFHPAPHRLSSRARKLHQRNYLIVFGARPQPRPVDLLVFWAPETASGVQGGTGQAVRIARHAGIPCLNLKSASAKALAEVLEALEPQPPSSTRSKAP